MIIIRHATLEDAALLAQISAETFFDAFAADNTPENISFYVSSAFSPEIQANELADPASIFLIAEIDGEATGYARLKEGNANPDVPGSRPVELVRFYARTRWIGKGVGPALMQKCLEQASQQGYDMIWLGVWERNPRAIAFYQKWGFVQVGTHIFQMGDEPQMDWVMQRKIEAIV